MVEAHIPDYEIVSVLGRGNTAMVYRAVFTPAQQPVALKVLDPRLVSDPAFVPLLRQEAREAALLKHPNVGRIYACGGTGSLCYLAMELIEGETLASILRRGALTPQQACHVVRQVGDALDYAHTEGVLHRDIRPANILLDEDGNVTMVDF